MQSTELEMRVLAALDAIANHSLGEDDLIEFKAEWPEAEKEKFVRQLAGSLNRASGEPVILVIGINERTGEHWPWTGKEMSNWWPSVQSHFDQVAPELIRDRTFQIAEGKSIRALAISSDGAPYVLKLASGSSSREIPIREGTHTKSASRDQIMRMFVPAVQVPKADVLRSGVTFFEDYGDPNPDSEDDGGMYFSGYIELFVEHAFNRSSVMFPRHRITGLVRPMDVPVKLTSPSWGVPESRHTQGHEGVIERVDGFFVGGPGVMKVGLRSDAVDWESTKGALQSDFLKFSVELPVSGTNRSVRIEQILTRNDGVLRHDNGSREAMAHWSYSH